MLSKNQRYAVEKGQSDTRMFEPITPDIVCEFKDNQPTSAAFHAHDGYEVLLFLEGEANFYLDRNRYHLTGGELILINPGEYHHIALIDEDNYKRVVVHVLPRVLKELSSEFTDLALCFKNAAGGVSKTGDAPKILQLNRQAREKYVLEASKLEAALNDDAGYGRDLLLKCAVTQFFTQLNRVYIKDEYDSLSYTTPELMQSILDYVDKHLLKDVRLDDMGKALNFNVIYMNRYFKGITGLTIGQYVLSRKVNLAKRYLLENYSVAEVCDMAGFNDYANFSRTFSKRVGCSPKEYRKASRDNKII